MLLSRLYRSKLARLVLILLSVAINSHVQADEHVGYASHELVVKSDLFKDEAKFKVTLPKSYQQDPTKRYVYLLDLHPRSHDLLVGMHDWMSHNGGWPWLETIIITAPDSHEGLGNLKRLAIEEKGNQQLLDFFEHDLIPLIHTQYRTNNFGILNGFTGNAGLGLYTLLNRPKLFNAYIAASPVLSNDFAYVLADAAQKLVKLPKQPRFLFVSTSDSQFEQRQLESFSIIEQQLQQHAPAQLNLQVKRFDGSYYMTQPVLATALGIEMIFNDVHQVIEPDSAIGKQGAAAILSHYQYLSEQVYGFTVPAVDSLTRLGKSQLSESPKLAIETLQLSVKHYPDNAHAHAALGEAYLNLNQVDDAKVAINKAMSLTQHPFWLNKWSKLLADAK
ncbi:alpha/beta hydrolase-fold protein [Shewanella gaetbuli]